MDDDQPTTNGPGRCLGGRFVLLDAIGVGGGAVVFRARDRQLHRFVAVKLLRSGDADLQCRFVHESVVLAGIDHPAIVRVLAHDSNGDEPYTVLELIEGPDLGEHLAQSGPLPWRRVLQIGIQIADALDAAHRQGLVHRDVKPANIMFADADARGQVKLIDFGIVRVSEVYRLPTGAVRPRPTGMGTALGTPGYLPLEAGLVDPNPSFDVFGLGATLYQLLTGKLPKEPLQGLREAHPGCDAPDDLGLVLAAALALEPEDRTQSAAELGRALAAVLAAHPERGTPSKRIDGRYDLIGLVGTGAKADAYLAVHRGAGHDVVLKFLRSKDPDDILRFTREAMLLQTFDNPALPRFYDHAPEASPPYIAMAHAPGRPASRLCAPPRLRPSEVAAVGVKLAEVLAVVHARGVLHRDINANNVLIDERGAVTLLDFGAAELDDGFYDVPAGERRYLTPPEARVVIPHGGIGTLAWSAPEVREGQGWTDKSDVYSMGHLLFRLLTGKVPVKGADPPTSPQVYASACPDDLAAAVMSALRVEPLPPPERGAARPDAELRARERRGGPRACRGGGATCRAPRASPGAHRATGPGDWTEHPIPETSSDPDPRVLPDPPSPPVAAVDAVTNRLPFRAAAVGLAALGLVWWGVHMSRTPPSSDHAADMLRAPATAAASTEDGSASQRRAPQAAVLASASPQPTPTPTMQGALDAVAAPLRRCSALAGGLLLVEFTTLDQGDTFGRVAVVGNTHADLDRCVREATADLRFAPRHAETFTKEYSP
jgi:serine/threonine protein kinase